MPRITPFSLGLPLLLAACNEPPGAAMVAIWPAAPVTEDDLEAVITTEAPDENGDPLTYRYRWLLDGAEQAELTDSVVSAALTAKGQRWEVQVWASDGKEEGPPAGAEAEIGNTPPEAEVSISPAAPETGDDLVASVSTTDADGDGVSVTWAWFLDGASTAYTDTTVPADATEKGQIWTAQATPSDGEHEGEPARMDIAIDNAQPVIDSLSMSPDPAYEGSLLELVIEAHDDDGEELAAIATWSVDGAVVQQGEGTTLDGASFDKGQQVSCELIVHDGFANSAPTSVGPVTILNSLPAASAVTVSPDPLYEASVASCMASDLRDDDGDAITSTVSWTVDGVEVSSAETLDGASFDRDQELVCAITACDEEGCADPVSSIPVTVSNTPPVLASLELSTSTPMEGDTLYVLLGDLTDDDDDPISATYSWRVNGAVVGSSTTLSSASFSRGDTVEVVVTPYDGTDWGSAVSSGAVTVINAPPTLSSLTISPSSPDTDDTLQANYSTSDADGDSVTVSLAWTVDGVSAGSATTLDGSLFRKNQVVQLTGTPSDGTDTGSPQTDNVTVLNTPPTAPTVAISPAAPMASDDLICELTATSSDLDGDGIDYDFAWTVGSSPFSGTGTSTWPGDTVPASATADHQEWTCTVTPSDDQEAGAPASATVTVGCVTDADGDGYYDADCGGDDCDDSDPTVNPGATEACDGVDTDCDGVLPVEETDADGDGFVDCAGCDIMGGANLQTCIDAAADGATLDISGGAISANISVSGKAITLVGDSAGGLTTWTCSDRTNRAVVVGSGAELTLQGFHFTGCDYSTSSSYESGVIRLSGCDLLHVDYCVFEDNIGYRGSVISTDSGSSPGTSGWVIVENSVMVGNQADDGGVFYINGETNIDMDNLLIWDNSAVDYCGALWLRDQSSSRSTMTRSVVYGNSAGRNDALESYSGSGAYLNSSIVYGNSPGNVDSSWSYVYSTIGSNPYFTDPSNGDFSLRSTSSAIDAGDPSLPTDPDGSRADRGCRLDDLPPY